MRNNKGFTLIELLAVIVILAIIAVITVPKIAEMIEDSRKGAAQDAAYGTVKAVELGYAKALQTNSSLGEVTCTAVADNKITCTDGAASNPATFTTEVSGTAPTGVNISVASGGSVKNTSTVTVNGYTCTGNSSSMSCTK